MQNQRDELGLRGEFLQGGAGLVAGHPAKKGSGDLHPRRDMSGRGASDKAKSRARARRQNENGREREQKTTGFSTIRAGFNSLCRRHGNLAGLSNAKSRFPARNLVTARSAALAARVGIGNARGTRFLRFQAGNQLF